MKASVSVLVIREDKKREKGNRKWAWCMTSGALDALDTDTLIFFISPCFISPCPCAGDTGVHNS